MELVLANHSSYPRIGDSADLQSLRKTIAQWEKNEKTEAELSAAEDRMTELALQDQLEAGLDVVTDGQIRWVDPISHLAGKLAGVRINGLLRFFDTNFYFRQPVVHAQLERTQALVVDDYLFAKRKSSRVVKPILTGPVTLARLSITENGSSKQAGDLERSVRTYTEALAEEVAALAAAGATLIQVEEPALLRHSEDFPWVETSMAALSKRKGAAELALALYFGDPAPIYDRLQTLSVDALVLDFTYNARLVEVIGSRGSSKPLGIGLMDGRNTRLEDPNKISHDLERIGRGLPMGRAQLMPSCGLEYLPRDRARMKLERMAAVRETFLGDAR